MVGDLIGEGAAQEEAVVGETPNLAARLQALAEPGAVVISQATRRLVGGLFELSDLGPQRLKGFAEPLAAWRVEGEGRAEGRFEALHGERLTPLVGRDHELGILLERWTWAKDGDGQVALLWGEPGIGKSRLTRSLLERLADEPHSRLGSTSGRRSSTMSTGRLLGDGRQPAEQGRGGSCTLIAPEAPGSTERIARPGGASDRSAAEISARDLGGSVDCLGEQRYRACRACVCGGIRSAEPRGPLELLRHRMRERCWSW